MTEDELWDAPPMTVVVDDEGDDWHKASNGEDWVFFDPPEEISVLSTRELHATFRVTRKEQK